MAIYQWKFQESISSLVQLFSWLSQLVFSISQNTKQVGPNASEGIDLLVDKSSRERKREGGGERELLSSTSFTKVASRRYGPD